MFFLKKLFHFFGFEDHFSKNQRTMLGLDQFLSSKRSKTGLKRPAEWSERDVKKYIVFNKKDYNRKEFVTQLCEYFDTDEYYESLLLDDKWTSQNDIIPDCEIRFNKKTKKRLHKKLIKETNLPTDILNIIEEYSQEMKMKDMIEEILV